MSHNIVTALAPTGTRGGERGQSGRGRFVRSV